MIPLACLTVTPESRSWEIRAARMAVEVQSAWNGDGAHSATHARRGVNILWLARGRVRGFVAPHCFPSCGSLPRWRQPRSAGFKSFWIRGLTSEEGYFDQTFFLRRSSGCPVISSMPARHGWFRDEW